MTADHQLPPATWTCHCPSDGLRFHAGGVFRCFICKAENPAGRRQTVPAAVAAKAAAVAAGLGQNPTNLPPPPQNRGGRPTPEPAAGPASAPRAAKRRPKGPNQVERMYNSVHLDGRGVFQGLRFAIASDDAKVHAYKPDWIANLHGRLVIVEVKDKRRHHHSHQRSRLAFDTARKEWAWLRAQWVWAEWDGCKFDTEVNETL